MTPFYGKTKGLLFLTATSLCLAARAVMAQEPPKSQATMTPAFVGTWRIDVPRTRTAAVALSYEQTGDTIRTTTPQGSYTFKIDGNDYPTAAKGETTMWKYIDRNTIETTSKRNGKIDAIATRVF